MKRPAFFGELEVAAAALEQPQIKGCLQLSDTPRKRGLRPYGDARRLAEPAMARDEIEIGQGEKIHRVPPVRRTVQI